MLLDIITNAPKEKAYDFYTKLIANPKDFSKITRKEIYQEIIKKYKEDPEIILRLCTSEEINILKSILINPEHIHNEYSYIDYLLFKNLQDNYLIIKEESYSFPSDILNYIKMALNLYNEKEYFYYDLVNSVLEGLIRIYNVILVDELLELLKEYSIAFTKESLKAYLKDNPRLKTKMKLVKYQKKDYLASCEYEFYKDIIKLTSSIYQKPSFKLEELISIGKYKINLFNEQIMGYLSYLEIHYKREYIDYLIEELIVYCGLDINNEDILRKMIEEDELLKETRKVISLFPMWLYNGNSEVTLNANTLIDKNDPCPCGSGKKYKQCCGKYNL